MTTRTTIRGLVAAVMAAGTVWAGRPLNVDDADPVPPGVVEMEAGVLVEYSGSSSHTDVPLGGTIGFGLADGLEAGVGFGWQLDRSTDELGPHARESGMLDVPVGAKWQFAGEAEWRPRLALAAAVNVPAADDHAELGSGEADYDLTAIASKALTPRLGLHLNAGFTWVGNPDGEALADVAHYGLAVDARLIERLQWVGEVYGESEVSGGRETLCLANTGIRIDAGHGLVIDLAAGATLAGEAADLLATVGLTWALNPAP